MTRPAATKPSSILATSPAPPKKMLVAEAARRCGWRRANTFRERFLSTDVDAAAMGLDYDERGRAVVDATAVTSAAAQVTREKAARPRNWRVHNLGAYARKRGGDDPGHR